MSKIKVLFIHHGSGWGGAPISMINLIKELDKSKFVIHVLLLKDSIVKERLAELSIDYTICNSYFYKNFYSYLAHTDAGLIKPYDIIKLLKIFSSWYLSKYFFASKVLKCHDYDIVHLNSSVLSDWLYPASRKGKVVFHIREPISKGYLGIRYKFIRSEAAKYADKIVAISKDNAARINLPNKTTTSYNFIQIPEKIDVTQNNKSILYVGGAAIIKGIEVLLEAIPLISKDIKITLVGHFPKTQSLGFIKMTAYKILYPKTFKHRKTLGKLFQVENVNLIGTLSEIKFELEQCTILVSPFTVPHFSRPVIEAFAYGKPVIASNVLGMDEIVDNNVNGILFKNGDAKEFAKIINELVFNDILLKEMGQNGRKKAIEMYSPSVNVQIIENIYIDLMNTNYNV